MDSLKCPSVNICTISSHLPTLKAYQNLFYGDLVYKFNGIIGKPSFSDHFKKIIKRYKRVGYNMDIMQRSAYLVVNPITVDSYGFLFNCTTVGQTSVLMTAPI